MVGTLRLVVGTFVVFYSWVGIVAQPALLQPADGATVFVPVPPNPGAQIAIDFDWADVPGATSYELTVQRVGGQTSQSIPSSRSRVLVPMLDIGTTQVPIQYSWTVTPHENGVPAVASAQSFFGVASGSVIAFQPGEEGPGHPQAGAELVTRLYFQNVGMVLEWTGVAGATGYEIQIVREEDLVGTPLEQLHYRMRVESTRAVVSNISIPAKYRFEVRAIVSGSPGNSSSGFFYLITPPTLDQTGDGIVNKYDLFDLETLWGQDSFPNNISGGDRIDQFDLIALLIRLKRSTHPLPGFRKGIAPEPAAPAHRKAPKTKPTKPVRTGWLKGLVDTVLGRPAYAGALPEGSAEIQAPRMLFPTCGSCGVNVIPLLWTEVPGATSYNLEWYSYNPAFRKVQDNTFESMEVFDDVAGDGIVSSERRFPPPNTFSVVRARAVMAGAKGPFSRPVAQFISHRCPDPDPRPIISLDFNGDRRYEGVDLFAYAAAWQSATPSAAYNPGLELDPPFFPDGDVAPDDLLAYLELFRERCFLPKSPPLAPPIQQSPPPNETVLNPVGNPIFVSWIPPATTEFSSPIAYEIHLTGGFFGTSINRKFTGDEFTFQDSLPDGVFQWRVRAIADDGTPGLFSPFRTFTVVNNLRKVQAPTLLLPAPGETLPGGSVRFVWTRQPQATTNQCRLDRLMIHNGEVFSVSFDVYHKASEVNQPTIEVEIPLFPNFGPDFRWAVKPFEESTDSLGMIFIQGGVMSEFRNFRIDRPTEKPEFSGLGTWKADIDDDGEFGFSELAQVQAAWKRGRDTDSGYDVNFDFNYNKIHEPSELIQIFDVFRGNINLLTTGRAAPIPLPHPSPDGVTPPLFSIPTAQLGTVLTWFPTSAAEKYLVEWIDPNYRFRAVYVEQLDDIETLSPASGETVVLDNPDDFLQLSWKSVKDTQEYEIQIRNDRISSARMDRPQILKLVVPSGINDPTMTLLVSAQEVVRDATPMEGDTFNYLVLAKACGHFMNLPPRIPIKIELNFEKSVWKSKGSKNTLNSQLRLPFLQTAQYRAPALAPGLNHWRVTGIGRGIGTSTGIPTRWNSFGIGNLGPGFQ